MRRTQSHERTKRVHDMCPTVTDACEEVFNRQYIVHMQIAEFARFW